MVFDKDHKKVLLVNHRKLGVWIEPGGHLEEGEFPHETAIREVLEETGLKVKIISRRNRKVDDDDFARQAPMPLAIMLEDVPYKDGHHLHYDFVYVAETGEGELLKNDVETDGIGWFTRKEVEGLKMFENVKQLVFAAFGELEVK